MEELPLFTATQRAAPERARNLDFARCSKRLAVECVRTWHSRLPKCQEGPWKYAFAGTHQGHVFVVALWNNPSTPSLPGHWLELRRLARSPDAPRNTCSRMLGWMRRFFLAEEPEAERLISYQDPAVHAGTIYKAAGWTAAYQGVNRERDRTPLRVGTTRAYRSNKNGKAVDSVGKIRWEKALGGDKA